ncbi:MAG TPA: zf-HC2 domain-containing protein [Thermoanaerobaculia bacterium]|jgi:hypothetical protein
MDHAEATTTYATDRYLLNDLSAAEADAFEEHYFDCAECTDDLRVGLRFMNGGREIAREAAAPVEAPVVRIDERRPRRSVWLPAAAGAIAAALVLVIATPLLMRQRPSMETGSAYTFSLGQSRGEADVPTLDGPSILLSKDVPLDPPHARYEARLEQTGGKVVLRSPLEPRRDGESTSIHVRHVPAGRYELVIVGLDPAGRPTEIARDAFIVR